MNKAVDFREYENLLKISNDKPGYYKWWCDKETLIFLTEKLEIDLNSIIDEIEQKDNKYSIYIGIAIKESLRSRINWHINQKHSKSAVSSGTLSTLRQSISSIVANNQYDEKSTNDFIDKLWIEYFELPYTIKSKEAKDTIHKIEKDAMMKNLFILNIQDNHHPKASEIKRKLKLLRRNSKL